MPWQSRQGKLINLCYLTDTTLVSSKKPQLEAPDELKQRIDEAAKLVPLEHLALSPKCGFATVLEGNIITMDDQRRKLDLVAQVAREVWGTA